MTPQTNRLAFETAYRVRFDEAGSGGLLRTSGFMRYAQDVAWQHSAALGFGREWYAERDLTWLVRAAELEILAPVPMGSTVMARTAVVGMRRVFARRRGEFELPDGRLAGWVHTDWVMIDGRGALIRIPPVFVDIFGGDDSTGRVGRVALPRTPPGTSVGRFGVRPHELDPMDHVNNAVYLDWFEEAISAAGPGTASTSPTADGLAADGSAADGSASERDALPRQYRMEYVMAAAAGAQVEGAAWRTDEGWSYRLTGPGGEPDLFRATMTRDEDRQETT